jgi:membrane-associated phospholipid phosphatase
VGNGAVGTRERRALWGAVLGRLLGGPRLVPVRLRPWVAVVAIVAIACLAGFGLAARHSGGPVLFDHSVDSFLRRATSGERRGAQLLDDAGNPRVFVTVTALVSLGLILVRDFRAALLSAASVTVAVILVERVLKPLFDRRLGDLPAPTFPSGHSAVAVALAGSIVLAAGRQRPLGRLLGRVGRVIVVAAVLLVACSIGMAMVVLQYHHFSDVLAGVPLGLAVSWCLAVLLDEIGLRWQASGAFES